MGEDRAIGRYASRQARGRVVYACSADGISGSACSLETYTIATRSTIRYSRDTPKHVASSTRTPTREPGVDMRSYSTSISRQVQLQHCFARTIAKDDD